MTACMICAVDALRDLPMHDKDLLVLAAREIIQGMVVTASSNCMENFKPPPRLGTCIVERCALFIETTCKGCRTESCPRCTIAAELRAAEDSINADRDAELAAIASEELNLERLLDNFVERLCAKHTPFGTVLFGQWYDRRSFLSPVSVSATAIDS